MAESSSPSPSGEDPRPDMRGAWILLFVVLTSATTAILTAAIREYPECSWWMAATILVAFLGSLMIGGLLLRDYSKAKSGTRPSDRDAGAAARGPKPASHAPQPFRARLATYLHVPESDVLPPRPRPVSSMPFWSSVPLSPRPIVMKSVEFIRAVLERIHAAVRG